MRSFKGILLDLDNTVYSYSPCHKRGLDEVFGLLKEKGLERKEEDFLSRFEKAKKQIKNRTQEQAASHNRTLYFQRYLEAQDAWSPNLVLELSNAYWNAYMQGMECSSDFLDFLKIPLPPIVIITDLTAHIQHRKIAKLGLEKSIKGIVTSEEAGREKPHPSIFELGLQRLGVNKDEVLCIGDNYDKDIKGAVDFGITAYWYQAFLSEKNKNRPLTDEIKAFTNFKEIHELFG